MVKDREAWHTALHGCSVHRHDLAAEEQNNIIEDVKILGEAV